MARITRQSARLVSKSSDTATPTSNASLCFSSRPQSLTTGAETPITSDVERDANEKAPSKTLRAKANSNKRVAETASDDEHSGSDNAQAPPAKRRAITNRSYVALAKRTVAKGKGKEKVLFYSYFKKF
jgi:DNA repair protein RAD16